MQSTRRFTRHVVALTAAASLAFGAAAAAVVAAPPAAHAATAEPEAPDFASDTYGDAWDYSDAADQNTDETGSPTSVTGGHLRVSLVPGDQVTLVQSVAGSLPAGRDGSLHPVDTSRYRSLSFSMDQPFSNRIGAVYWWTCRAQTAACGGGITFPVTSGSTVYDLPLDRASTLQGKVPWTDAKVVALRLDPVVVPAGGSGTATIDWTRLHGAGGPHAAYPPGDHGSFSVAARPQPVVDSPNPSEGEDLATAQGRRPWEFANDPAAASGFAIASASVLRYDDTGMVARNTGPDLGDPQIQMPVSPFSGSEYHNLSIDYSYDGSYSLAAAPGGGKVVRVIWAAQGSSVPQIGNDILTYSGQNAGTIDIDLTARDPLDEDALAPRRGWSGRTVSQFRFDPNEDPSALVWHLRAIHLRADPRAVGATTVRFHDAAWVSGATAEVAVQAGGSTSWTPIASDVPVAQGTNTVPFALGSMAAGKYEVRVTIEHPGVGSQSALSSSVVDVQRDPSHDPKGSYESLVGGAGNVTVGGWSLDQDAASTVVRFYEGATYLGQTTTTLARSDVQRGYPAAPLTSGFRATLTMPAGQHTVCAYAINAGAGQNTVLGCRTTTVAAPAGHDPLGSFDSVTATGTGASVDGWAYDPDAPSTTVRFYEGATYLGSAVTAVPRTDVQRGHPDAPLQSGFRAPLSLGVGTHSVCAYAINTGAGANTVLGCRSVTVRTDTSHDARGSFDSVVAGAGTATVSGWAYDPDGTPVTVRVYEGAAYLGAVTTSLPRADVQRSVPGAPLQTGWSRAIALGAGQHQLCAYAITVGPGENAVLGCRTVRV
ncbi:hypothetical protein NY588_10125 [Curtobacterium flaccumfaciens pv. beticola]|uniref:hypothetical protein n=1 Tax=Curtobacterium flaccumfaciens TaxID=2035 RepID=UPI00349F70CF|nr:hypothetical protein [Curtobacterium flaccumfaciens pv. basellae]